MYHFETSEKYSVVYEQVKKKASCRAVLAIHPIRRHPGKGEQHTTEPKYFTTRSETQSATRSNLPLANNLQTILRYIYDS
jgi:hypothetical protein